MEIAQPTCLHLYKTFSAFQLISVTASEAIYWVCLFALLEGKTRYFVVLVLGFLSLTVPALVFHGQFINDWITMPLPAVNKALGYACAFNFGHPNMIAKHATAMYINLGRITIVMVAAIITLYVRYRKHDNNLIKVIRREGALYYLFAWLIIFFAGLTNTPKGKIVNDKYNLVASFKPLVATIFAERLLLMMQTVTTPATHAVVTSLVFEKDVAMVSAEDKTFEEKGKSAEYSSSNDSPISRNVELQTSRPTREEVRREGSYV